MENESMGKTWERRKIAARPFLFLPFFFLLGSLFLSPPALAAGPTKPKNVLILFHGAPGQPFFDMTLSEVRRTIQRDFHSPLNLYVEYLDAERFPEKYHVQAEFDFIKRKYTTRKMDLFIPAGPNILLLISQYLSPEFDEIPTVFVDFRVGYPDRPPIDRKPNMTGLITEPEFKKTFEMILSLHPGTREVFIIAGSSPYDRFMESLARVAYREYEDRVKVTYLTGLSMEELLQKISSLPKKSIIIYMSMGQDAKGINYYSQESLRLLSQASSVPLYGIMEDLLGRGIVGGYVLGLKRNGVKIGQLALRILQGEHPSTIPVERGAMLYMFDWKEMKRWGIQESRLPEGSIIINKELTFWEEFRWYIIGTGVFVIIETLLVVFLIILYRRQNRIQKRLHEAAEEWQTTFDSVPDLIFILDLDLKILRVNAPALAFLRLPLERVLGSHCCTLMHGTNEPPEKCPTRTIVKMKRHEDVELYDEKRNAWFHISVNPILNDRGEVTRIVHQVRDITGQKRTNEEIQQARTELLRVERSFRVSELAASIAHELNQPLAAILSNAQAALRFLESDRLDLKEFREILGDIIYDDKRAGNVIRSLRSMMKREEGEKKSVILNEVLKDVITILHSEAVFRQVDIETELAESLPLFLADRIQLQQVILNLIMNAVEATAQSSPGGRKIIVQTQASRDGFLRLSVRDSGRGVDPENLERVFHPFFTTKGSGLGMGLALSKSIIEAHRGRIWAENNADGGATFIFEVPILGRSGK